MNQLEKLISKMDLLEENQMGLLKGGFSVLEFASSTVDLAGNVNVDVSGHTCACDCGTGPIIIERD